MISLYAIEVMGFKELVEAGSIEASFMSVTAFEVRGIAVAGSITEVNRAQAAGAECRVAISADVQRGYQCGF